MAKRNQPTLTSPAAAGSFDYLSMSTVTIGVCPPTTVSCGGVQTFTIAN